MGIDHVAINVADIHKSVRWYVEFLDAAIDYQDDTWAMLKVGESKVALALKSQHPPHIAVTVDEFPEGSMIKEHRDGSRYVYKSDPDGNIIELISYT